MRVHDCNWMQLERYLERDDRVVLPVGSTEQHAYLSLGTDNILAERVSVEAAEPLGIPVLPVLPYGITPYFARYPGSPTLTENTLAAVLGELVESLRKQGFRRVLIVNGHGGNSPISARVAGGDVLWHDWWRGPKVWALVESIDRDASHASWLENFPWTRLPGVELPSEKKPVLEREQIVGRTPDEVRDLIGDGSWGGLYERSDEEMLRIWHAGVEEVRKLLETGWPA
jgi:creatinine amidohydrolase